MRKTLTALLAATTLGVAALPSSAEARWGWGWGGFGIRLATGAIVGGALAAGAYSPYYGYGYGYGRGYDHHESRHERHERHEHEGEDDEQVHQRLTRS
jgi:hypothetical protein